MTVHREEVLYVPHVDHNSALIAWGAFYLEERKSREGDPAGSFRFQVLDDDDLKRAGRIPGGIRERGSIGRNTTPFGPARVRLGTGSQRIEWGAWREVGNVPFTWIPDLQPGSSIMPGKVNPVQPNRWGCRWPGEWRPPDPCTG